MTKEIEGVSWEGGVSRQGRRNGEEMNASLGEVKGRRVFAWEVRGFRGKFKFCSELISEKNCCRV
jgi:hypothetical protein